MQWSGRTLRHPPFWWRCWLWQWLMMVAEMFMMFVTFSPQKMLALSNTRHSTLCSLLHCSSANVYIGDAHLQMLICKWKWWHWRYSTRGNYLHRFWMKLTFLAKWISAFLAPRTVVDELLESESFSDRFVKLCSHETFSGKMERALQINYFPTLKHPRHWGSLKPWV